MAVLELIKARRVVAEQQATFGEIYLSRAADAPPPVQKDEG